MFCGWRYGHHLFISPGFHSLPFTHFQLQAWVRFGGVQWYNLRDNPSILLHAREAECPVDYAITGNRWGYPASPPHEGPAAGGPWRWYQDFGDTRIEAVGFKSTELLLDTGFYAAAAVLDSTTGKGSEVKVEARWGMENQANNPNHP